MKKPKYSNADRNMVKKGRVPIGDDGYPMEIHHIKLLSKGGTNSVDNLKFMTRTKHRLGKNYSRNHRRKRRKINGRKLSLQPITALVILNRSVYA